MGTELEKSCTLKINNFSDRKEVTRSKPFSCGGCEWYVIVDTQGCAAPGYDNDLSLILCVHNPESLRLGWKRRVRFFFLLLNYSGKELCRSYYDGRSHLFCAEATEWGVEGLLPLTELQDLENNILTIQVFVGVDEVVHRGQSTENDLLEFHGVQILASQNLSATRLLKQHLGFGVDFAPKYPELRTVYYTLLFSLIETLSKSPQSLSLAELTNAQSQLTELTKAGFKLDFLESKLEDLSLERKKAVVQLEERVKNVEPTLEKIKYAAAARVSSFGFIDFLVKRFSLFCFSI